MVSRRVMQGFIENPTAAALLAADGTYAGWVSAMHGGTVDGSPVHWDLNRRDRRFGLYLLASAWSRAGRWEGGARAALAMASEPTRFLNPTTWTDDDAAGAFSELQVIAATRVRIPGGRPARLRSDCVSSFFAVAVNLDHIETTMADLRSGRMNASAAFRLLRSIKGTAARGNCWNIKLPLIFRELRCQGWREIPGDLCCVPDVRVRRTYRRLGHRLPTDVRAASRIIYRDFGDLYDIPAFLFPDQPSQRHRERRGWGEPSAP